MNKASRILLIWLISALSVSSAFAGGRAGRLQLQPFFGSASTEENHWSPNQKNALLYGAQADLFLTDKIAIGVSYTQADYWDRKETVDFGNGITPAIFPGPVAEMAHFRLKFIPFDAGPISPYLKGSTGYLGVDQENFRIVFPSAFSYSPVSGKGISYSVGAGAVVAIERRWGVFFEVSRIWSDVAEFREGFAEEFWTLKTGLSLWY